MSSTPELFAGEDWTVLYRAFASINFNGSDPSTISAALRQYIAVNYPEDYADWTASSEFAAILDLLSWLAGTLAFRTDIAVREGFADTATTRASILRLARFLSYNPSRNRAANGLLKVITISTDDHVLDDAGNDLVNTKVIWNDPDNQDWLLQFQAILDNALVQTNPVGQPIKTGTVDGVPTQSYRVNSYSGLNSLALSERVAGTTMVFEVCNADFDDGGSFRERTPDPQAAFHMLLLDDDSGPASATSGFFVLFKQGNTTVQNFNIATPVANQVLTVTGTGVNQEDVWVQSLDASGNVTVNWTRVPTVLSSSITNNVLPAGSRNIFSVLTGDEDTVSILFSDGVFGNAPNGIIRVTTRISNGLTYTVQSADIQQSTISLNYYNTAGSKQTLNLTLGLQEPVSNAVATETIEAVRSRMTSVYATQNRMVSGEDYCTFPLSTNLAAKVKAINRLYSGQSRYFDLADPIGTVRHLSVFGDDGVLFAHPTLATTILPASLGLSTGQLFGNLLTALLAEPVRDAMRDYIVRVVATTSAAIVRTGYQGGTALHPLGLTWTQSTAVLYEDTGWFSYAHSYITVGSMVQVRTPNGTVTWVGVVDLPAAASTLAANAAISDVPLTGSAGPVTLAASIPTGSTVIAVLPAIPDTLDEETMAAAFEAVGNGTPFSLSYDFLANDGQWSIAAARPLTKGDLGYAYDAALIPYTVPGELNLGFSPAPLQVANVDTLATGLRFVTIAQRLVFESLAQVRWFDDGTRAPDGISNSLSGDVVSVLGINRDLADPSHRALRRTYGFTPIGAWTYPDGTPEPRRTVVTLADTKDTGFPDDPDAFYRVVDTTDYGACLLFWQRTPTGVVPLSGVTVYRITSVMLADMSLGDGAVAFAMSDPTSILSSGSFWVFNATTATWNRDFTGAYSYGVGRGPNVAGSFRAPGVTGQTSVVPTGDALHFQWKHAAPQDRRIDPSQSNLHDIYVLPYAYDAAVRAWIASGCPAGQQPAAPSEFELATSYASMEQFRMFSDGIVWRPVRYKFLFGANADPELQASFAVVLLPNATLSDAEVEVAIIAAINDYFAPENWDFGDTFFFTELAAYVHLRLAGVIGSIVPVPRSADGLFGDGFQIACRPDELFISTAQTSDIEIVASNTAGVLRLR